MKKKNAFRKWLDKKGLSYQQFIDAVNDQASIPTLKYRTVIGWVLNDSVPRDANQADIVATYPDCPLLTGRYAELGKKVTA